MSWVNDLETRLTSSTSSRQLKKSSMLSSTSRSCTKPISTKTWRPSSTEFLLSWTYLRSSHPSSSKDLPFLSRNVCATESLCFLSVKQVVARQLCVRSLLQKSPSRLWCRSIVTKILRHLISLGAWGHVKILNKLKTSFASYLKKALKKSSMKTSKGPLNKQRHWNARLRSCWQSWARLKRIPR